MWATGVRYLDYRRSSQVPFALALPVKHPPVRDGRLGRGPHPRLFWLTLFAADAGAFLRLGD